MKPLALIALLLLTQAAAGQPFDSPPPAGPVRPLQMAAPQEDRLPNGLRVVVARRGGLPLVSARLLVLTGAEADPPRQAGLAALTAGLLTRGTRRHGAPAQAAAAEALGGTLQSDAGWHQAGVGLTVTTPRLDAALALVADAAMQPAFQPAELARLRAEALDEMKLAHARPGALADMAANRMLFGDGAYGHPQAGTPASLPRITRSDVLRLHREHYRPDNAVLVLAGDMELPHAMALARKHFGAWRAPAQQAPAPAVARGTPSAHTLALIDMGNSGQAGVSLALPLPAAGAADQAAGEVANAVLGGGYSSRLNQEIRIKRGLSYGAGSSFEARRLGGLLHAQVQTKNTSAAEVLALLQGEIDRLATSPVAAEELAARKATLIGGYSRSVETTAGLVARLSALLANGRPVAGLVTRIDSLEAVDAAAVQRYAGDHFAAAARRAAVAGDAAVFADTFQALPQGGQPAPLRVKAAAVDLGP